VWQKLYDALKDQGFIVIAVAMDSDVDAARPWIEAAAPDYPALIDRDHRVAELYNMVNVPEAVWIDETGTIVRPAENAGAYEGFRQMDLETWTMPEDELATTIKAKATYVEAIGDWVRRGAACGHLYKADQAKARTPLPSTKSAQAHCHFHLGQYLLRHGRDREAQEHLAEASRLHPNSWNIWRQAAEKNETGLAASAEFWARVNALGDDHYYPPVDMEGMPK
jgi:hypothetical protein